MKRYYLEITPLVRDMYGTPRNRFGTTKYLIDSEVLQLPEMPETFLVSPYNSTFRGPGGQEFSVQFEIRLTDADAPQPEVEQSSDRETVIKAYQAGFAVGRLSVEGAQLKVTPAGSTNSTKTEPFKDLLNAVYGKKDESTR